MLFVIFLVILLLVFFYIRLSKKKTNNLTQNNQQVPELEIKIGDRVVVKRNGYAHIVIRKGMTGIVTEIRPMGEYVIQFDGLPFEICVPLWMFHE